MGLGTRIAEGSNEQAGAGGLVTPLPGWSSKHETGSVCEGLQGGLTLLKGWGSLTCSDEVELWLSDSVQFSLPCAQLCLIYVTDDPEWPLQTSITVNAHPASSPLPTWALLPGLPLCVLPPPTTPPVSLLHFTVSINLRPKPIHPSLAGGTDTPAIPASHLDHSQITPRPAPRQAWGVCSLSSG